MTEERRTPRDRPVTFPPAQSSLDCVTILTSHTRRMAKLVGRDDRGAPAVLDGYEDAATFRVTERLVPDLDRLARLLEALNPRWQSCIIRGEPMPDINRRRCRRRLFARVEVHGEEPATFRPAARRWLALDFDGIVDPGFAWLTDPERTARYLLHLLPWQFGAAGTVIQATGSAGIKPGIRARLWCILDRPVSDAQAKRWLADAPVDRSLFNAIQVHYTAAPVFTDGIADPLPWRVVKVQGPSVSVPDLPEPAPAARSRCVSIRGGTATSECYAAAALQSEANAIAAAPIGERHHRLHLACIKLWRLIASRSLTVSEAASALIASAMASGIDEPVAVLQAFVARSFKSAARQAAGASR